MNFKVLKQISEENLMPTYNKYDIALIKGRGSLLADSNEKKYIDFTSGIGVTSLGHADADWVYSVCKQTKKLAHSSNLFYNEPSVNLAKTLTGLSNMSKVFFSNSGAEANECAIKLARKYSFKKYGPNRHTILTLNDSFHGRTLATLSATAQDSFHNFFDPFPQGFDYVERENKAALSERMSKCDICAVMIELIQGEGGVNVLSRDYVSHVYKLCKEKDILIIVDEVQTGIGRTGSVFAFEQYNISPNIVSLAKGLGNGLPIGACICDDSLAKVFSPGDHGSTFGGNPIICAGALVVTKNLSPSFLAQVTKKGDYIMDKLSNFRAVQNIFGMGLMIGFSVKNGSAKEIAKLCSEKGLLILTAKDNVRMLPALNISYREINKGLKILETVLEEKNEKSS